MIELLEMQCECFEIIWNWWQGRHFRFFSWGKDGLASEVSLNRGGGGPVNPLENFFLF